MPRITVDEFMRKPPRVRRGRPSLLAPYGDDLKKMRALRYPLSDMQSFLALNKVEVSISTISMHFARQRERDKASSASTSSNQASAG
ncbi:hypothetical protein JWH16_04330 [Xanthomonas campestris pv. campestris]|uniref:hypothetical protein n=1 Tax=Xanthomonas campestris TaxID=339 RepID=UPI001E2D36EE|nr:hypothetical protein [Xanthomonas campestris]MCD0253082.1 hypothetical protein [Xanthomonas campestris pv. campestris]